MNDELGGQIMKKILGLTAKKHSFFKENNDEAKKAKGTKKNVSLKENLNLKIFKTV